MKKLSNMKNMKAVLAMFVAVMLSTSMVSCMSDTGDIPEEAEEMMGIYQGIMEVTSDYGDTAMVVKIQVANAISIKPMPLLFMVKPFLEIDPESDIAKQLSSLAYTSPYGVSVNDAKDSVYVFIPTSVSAIPLPMKDKYHELDLSISGANMQTVYSVKNQTLNLVLKSKEAVYDNAQQNSYKGVTMTVKNARKLIGEN